MGIKNRIFILVQPKEKMSKFYWRNPEMLPEIACSLNFLEIKDIMEILQAFRMKHVMRTGRGGHYMKRNEIGKF